MPILTWCQGNIVIDEPVRARLTDFGLALLGNTTALAFTNTRSGRGSLRWMAPERCFNDAARRTQAMDVYAYACVCYYVSSLIIAFVIIARTCGLALHGKTTILRFIRKCAQ
jgi:serine/threonine protein kinase